MASSDPLFELPVFHIPVDTGLLFRFLGVVAFLVLIIGYAVVINREKLHPEFETIGFEKGSISFSKAKNDFVAQGRELLFAGLRKFQGPFQVISASGPTIVFPSRYANELKKHDKNLSFDGFIKREFFPHVPGFEGPGVSVHSRIIQDSVRTKLTQSLNLITKDLCDETESTLHDMFGESQDWNSCYFQRICPDLVARLSSRVFLGPVVARNKEWLQIAVDYTISLMKAQRVLRLWPSLLVPLVHHFIPECRELRTQSQAGRRIIDGEIKRRRVKWAEDIKNGRKVSKTADSLGWMQEMSQGRPFDMAAGQLGLTFAAIHTTSDLLTKVLFQLCKKPKYIQALREEMISVLSKDGWKKTSLYQMKLLDSTLKETQRLEPPSIVTSARVAMTPVILDGRKIPEGTHLKVVTDANYDADIYPDPETFDPYRFLKLREQPGQENNWQFVTPCPESLGFGHGVHACPGRFFASNEVKIALCWMLLKYDWRLEEGTTPQNIWVGTEVIADPNLKVMYRRRTEEIDLVGLLDKE
ncbi:ent-kaurene oxidase [Viridothelium virens]|uniref:Ent-kaurene oxidase n=1 Tax=Viridothelium virens TaxID=1048519 RepID=A0A6A6HIE6_VIRVR|nr:ent-kaurene oxidase [Viridothelium virens]